MISDGRLHVDSLHTWQEKTIYIADFHSEKVAEHGQPLPGKVKNGWSLQDTASHFCLSNATISYDLRLAKQIKEHPQVYLQIRSRNQAIEMMNKGGDVTEVEVKYSRAYLTGRVIKSFEHDSHTYYMVRLKKPIQTNYLDIDVLTLPSTHCRILRDEH